MTGLAAAGTALAAARARRDSHFPDAAAAAAEAAQPGDDPVAVEAAIRALWDDAIATQTPTAEPPAAAGHPVSA